MRFSKHDVLSKIIGSTVLLFALALIVSAITFASQGGRWFIIETPSMGQAAPVGTLVFTSPAKIDTIKPGEIISFHPSTEKNAIYTHRVVSNKNGVIVTKGDNNGSNDGWTVQSSNIIGKAGAVLPGWGWLIKGLPYLMVGIFILFLLTRFIKPKFRTTVWLSGISLTISAIVYFLKPFVNIIVVTVTTTANHATALIVSTGLLPIEVKANNNAVLNLVSGQQKALTIPLDPKHNFYQLSAMLDLPLWGWIIFWFLCLTPLLYVMIVGLPPTEEKEKITEA